MSLKRHDKGTEVKKLQKALIDLGYPLPRWGVDGDLGNETMEAVDKLLTSHGLDYGGLTDNDEISINDLNFIYALLKKKPAPLPVAKDMFFDRRSVSTKYLFPKFKPFGVLDDGDCFPVVLGVHDFTTAWM